MSSLDEKIARAQAALSTRPIFKDITVSLDSALSDERAALLTQLGELYREKQMLEQETADTLTMAPDTAAVDKRINQIASKLKKIDALEQDTLITIRIYRAAGTDWMDLKAACPPRINSAIDRGCGYNINTLTVAACAANGRILEGDQEVTRDLDAWTALLALLSGGEFERVADLVYQVNVFDSQQRTEQLKNSYEAATASAKK